MRCLFCGASVRRGLDAGPVCGYESLTQVFNDDDKWAAFVARSIEWAVFPEREQEQEMEVRHAA